MGQGHPGHCKPNRQDSVWHMGCSVAVYGALNLAKQLLRQPGASSITRVRSEQSAPGFPVSPGQQSKREAAHTHQQTAAPQASAQCGLILWGDLPLCPGRDALGPIPP